MFKHLYIFSLLLGLSITFPSCQHSSDEKKVNNFEAPSSKKQGLLVLNSRACYFDDVDSIEKKIQIKLEPPSKREQEQVKSIMQYAGLPQNFKIYRGDIDNAMATMVDNQRLIIYNKDLFTTLDATDNSYWASMFIIAHEIGHHLAYNISDTSNSLQAELDADIFASTVLCRMGADSNQVTAAIASSFISNNRDTKTHPAKSKRLTCIKQSWEQMSDLRFNAAIPPPADGPGGDFDFYHLYWENHYSDGSDSTHTRSMYIEEIPDVIRHLEGIIVDVVKLSTEEDGIATLEVGVLLTKTSPDATAAGFLANHRYQFYTCYIPITRNERARYFFEDMVGGRRIRFDILKAEDIYKSKKMYTIVQVGPDL